MSTDNQLEHNEEIQEVETSEVQEETSLRDSIASALEAHLNEGKEESQEVEQEEEQEEQEEDDEEIEEGVFSVREDLKTTFDYLKKSEREDLEKSNLPPEIVNKYLEKVRDQNLSYQEKTKDFSDLRKVLEPYGDTLALQGITPAQKISQYIAIEKQIMANPLEGILQLAKSYGVDLVKSLEDKQSEFEDPALKEVSNLRKELEAIKSNTQKQQEEALQRQQEEAIKEVNRFKAEKTQDGTLKYPHFEKIKSLMSEKFSTNSASTLEEAYNLVVKDLGLPVSVVQSITGKKSVKDAKKAALGVRSKSSTLKESTVGLTLREEIARNFEKVGRI